MINMEQWKLLRAMMDRIIPADDYPGAWEAGVGDYLARQFEGDLQPLVEAYRVGLDALEAEALRTAGSSFAGLAAAAQDALLRRVEEGQVTTSWMVDAAGFMRMVTEHVMDGYYSDPGNGGNRDGVSWQMIGFEAHE